MKLTRFTPGERAMTLAALGHTAAREDGEVSGPAGFWHSDAEEVAAAEEYARLRRLEALQEVPRKPPTSAEAVTPPALPLVRGQSG